MVLSPQNTDYGHPERAFFSKIRNFWAWADKLGTPKYSQNKIWAVQNLENSVRTSVFGAKS